MLTVDDGTRFKVEILDAFGQVHCVRYSAWVHTLRLISCSEGTPDDVVTGVIFSLSEPVFGWVCWRSHAWHDQVDVVAHGRQYCTYLLTVKKLHHYR